MSILTQNSERKLTPLMEQYWQQKSAHPDKIILFRMGDFYEIFEEDAVIAAPILGIALTSRNKKSPEQTKMCGVPHHSIAGPINKLLAAGFKVAICDQLEDPKFAKGIVKRGVTRILSPGVVYDPEALDVLKANYLAAFDDSTFSFLEATTGEFFYFPLQSEKDGMHFIESLHPAELVLTPEQKDIFLNQKKSVGGPYLTSFTADPATTEKLQAELAKAPQFQKQKLSDSSFRLLSYAVHMQGFEILHTLGALEKREVIQNLKMSSQVIRHLELFENSRGEKEGSLFHTLNRAKTASGARLLKSWMSFPLAKKEKIEKRQTQVAFWVENATPSQKSPGLKSVRDALSAMGDLERRLSKISNPSCGPRDLQSLAKTLEAGLEVSAITSFYPYNKEAIQAAHNLVQKIEATIEEDAPLTLRKTYFVRKGVSPELDDCIELTTDAESRVLKMEEEEKAQTGITSLKIRSNGVFGYYIEVTHTHKEKIPSQYLRKQTLANAERFTTEALQTLERKILSAQFQRIELETAFFHKLREEILSLSHLLLLLAHQWSELDVYTSLAYLALEQKFVKPQFTSDGSLQLKDSRHPVVEILSKNPFVPNSLELVKGECLLLTGPNMAGKSTLMRQVASISLLAQIGSFVPAKSASLPIFDRIFTRIGASDALSEGLSTFMVEMTETAEIFQNLTDSSLILLDEIGRGTSTYDGMSLAQAILENLVVAKGAISLFATHYHELTRLHEKYPQIHNAHMAIQEQNKDLKFLYQIRKGPANKSYGIHVAKLAGLPVKLTRRAEEILQDLEAGTLHPKQMSLFDLPSEEEDFEIAPVVSSISEKDQALLQAFAELKLDEMNPMQALMWLNEWKTSQPL